MVLLPPIGHLARICPCTKSWCEEFHPKRVCAWKRTRGFLPVRSDNNSLASISEYRPDSGDTSSTARQTSSELYSYANISSRAHDLPWISMTGKGTAEFAMTATVRLSSKPGKTCYTIACQRWGKIHTLCMWRFSPPFLHLEDIPNTCCKPFRGPHLHKNSIKPQQCLVPQHELLHEPLAITKEGALLHRRRRLVGISCLQHASLLFH